MFPPKIFVLFLSLSLARTPAVPLAVEAAGESPSLSPLSSIGAGFLSSDASEAFSFCSAVGHPPLAILHRYFLSLSLSVCLSLSILLVWIFGMGIWCLALDYLHNGCVCVREREREREGEREELLEVGGLENVENVLQNRFTLKQIEPYVCLFVYLSSSFILFYFKF